MVAQRPQFSVLGGIADHMALGAVRAVGSEIVQPPNCAKYLADATTLLEGWEYRESPVNVPDADGPIYYIKAALREAAT